MTAKLFVGNIAAGVTRDHVQELFEQAGTVVSVEMHVNRETGRHRGFAHVEMGTAAEAEDAIERFDGQEFDGRRLRVAPA